jgi:Phage portal protein, SPP1 Gp6-like
VAELTDIAKQLIEGHANDTGENGRLGRTARYLAGGHDIPYAPAGARAEFYNLARKSITNWLPLISDTFSKGLFVDGFRPARSPDNAVPWRYWQANGLDARQTIAHRGALEFGTSYVLVLPGDPEPLMRPLSPLRTSALYADIDDEYPAYGLILRGTTLEGDRLFDVLDPEAVHHFRVPKNSGRPDLDGSDEHGLGRTPMVRFRERLDGDALGIIAPLTVLQDRINEAVFSLLIALQYASFRQRWATGLAVPIDEETNEPVEPFEAAVNRLWVSDSADTKFGDFAQTDVSGHLRSYESAVRTMAAIAQTPPDVLLGELVNLSADALAAARDATQRKIGEYETIMGEAWEQAFRLAAYAAGDTEAAQDTSSEVRWRDTEARSLAATVDALGKMAQMLSVPAEGLWERIPGVTDGDVERWRELAGRADGMAALSAALTRQAEPVAPPPETAEVGPAA